MQSTQTKKSKYDWRRTFWQDVKTEEGMKQAIAAGYWSSYIIAGVTAAFVPFGVARPEALVDVVIMIVAGLCIQFYKSRTAAIISFLLFSAGKIFTASEGNLGGNWVLMVILILGLLGGIRGTFSYQSKKRND